jgi:hypothetical protein
MGRRPVVSIRSDGTPVFGSDGRRIFAPRRCEK